jgi:hypothetical protein
MHFVVPVRDYHTIAMSDHVIRGRVVLNSYIYIVRISQATLERKLPSIPSPRGLENKSQPAIYFQHGVFLLSADSTAFA